MFDIETIKEMWMMTEGGEMPKDFINTVQSFAKHKCAFRPIEFTESDFAACVMNYKLFKSMSGRISDMAKKSSKGDKDGE